MRGLIDVPDAGLPARTTLLQNHPVAGGRLGVVGLPLRTTLLQNERDERLAQCRVGLPVRTTLLQNVYKNEKVAGGAHAYHENCDCVIIPGFEGLPADKQVDGYDPDGMLERWHDCESAIDWDGAKERWESMDSVQRGRYKGDSDHERYASYVNAQVRREVETRDWRWLYTGELPKQTKERGAKPLQKERATADVLSKVGFSVKFIKEVYKTRVKTADAYLNGDIWKFKVPEGWSGEHTVRKQFYKARDKGTSKLVLSLLENGADLDEAYPLVRKTLDSGDYPYIDEVLIVGRDGSLIRVK